MSDLRDRMAFCRVVELNSFAGAARDLGIPTATISMGVKRLEDTLGIRLLERTTRRVTVTEAGQRYYDQITPVLDDIRDIDAAIATSGKAASGRVRIAAPTHLAEALLVPQLEDFIVQHPQIQLDFMLEDRPIDMIAEGIDISLRIGPLSDTGFIAKKMGEFEQILCAAPEWVARHGAYNHPQEIPSELPIAYRFPRASKGYPWTFSKSGRRIEVTPVAHLMFDDLDTYVAAGTAGLGPVCVLSFQARRAIDEGRFVRMLADWTGGSIDVHAITPERRLRSRRVTLVLDWLERSLSIRAS